MAAQAQSLLAGSPALTLRYQNDELGDRDGLQAWETSVELPLWLIGPRDAYPTREVSVEQSFRLHLSRAEGPRGLAYADPILAMKVCSRRVEGPVQVNREQGTRMVVVVANVRGRNLSGCVEEAKQKAMAHVDLPTGCL